MRSLCTMKPVSTAHRPPGGRRRGCRRGRRAGRRPRRASPRAVRPSTCAAVVRRRRCRSRRRAEGSRTRLVEVEHRDRGAGRLLGAARGLDGDADGGGLLASPVEQGLAVGRPRHQAGRHHAGRWACAARARRPSARAAGPCPRSQDHTALLSERRRWRRSRREADRHLQRVGGVRAPGRRRSGAAWRDSAVHGCR